MFQSVASSVRFPELEAQILQFWKERGTYEQSLVRRQAAPRFVFYEGPPTANGLPHPGHCLTRAIKDLYPRYRTMRGYLCERKAGWDTHGLPVEVEVCKELGIHSWEEIYEKVGITDFIHRCLESVFRYTREWERLTERLGFWVNLDEAYVTYHQSYIESVWWALKSLFDRKLLYEDYKIVWWWAQGGTALSAGEVSQGRREVADPSVYVRFPIIADDRAKELGVDENTSLLIWTTTPWTLPSNQFAAVHKNLDYAFLTIGDDPKKSIVACERLGDIARIAQGPVKSGPVIASGNQVHVLKTFKGSELIGLRYFPPYDFYYRNMPPQTPDNITLPWGQQTAPLCDGSGEDFLAWRVVDGSSFVGIDSGTGVVHIAPSYGEEDYALLLAERQRFMEHLGPQLFGAVHEDGKFGQEFPELSGMWIKDADKPICRDLRSRGLLFHQEQFVHEYPFCWRAEEDPLIQYPRRSWFIRTTRFKDDMLANNEQINWLPEHIKHGRFGNFLETNVDWALSRERFWGTPLPIWKCEETGEPEAVGSYAELLAKPGVFGTTFWEQAKEANPALSEHLKVHKPYIDHISYDSPFATGKRMRRVRDVIDCWFDSGAMPFAQWGYPHQGKDQFDKQFPADFISEALDQTRGWFYSQLAISTMLFGDKQSKDSNRLLKQYPHPFRNCIVLGLMLAEWWESKDGKLVFLSEEEARAACGENGFSQKVGKMSKSKRNYREPNEIFDRYGADALRWYFFANQPPWTSIRYSEQAIKDSIPEFLLRLWHVYSFFVIYANIDGFDPAQSLAGKVEQLSAQELSAAKTFRPAAERGELDQWILGELNRTAAAVVERMDAYDNFAACGHITQFVDALSNWYVRRSRPRFWSEDKKDPAKLDAYWTLYECLLTTSKLIAPFVPFLAEALWQNLAVAAVGQSHPGQGARLSHPEFASSVHFCDYPTGDARTVDSVLSARMNVVREIVSLGRSARMGAKLKVRQPLAKVEVILVNREHQPWLQEHSALIAEELNVHEVEFTQQADRYITYTVLPDLKRLGPRLGKRLPEAKAALAKADAAALLAKLEAEGQVALEMPGDPVTLDSQDLQIRLQAKPGWAAAQGPDCVVVLSTELNDELIAEGHAREIVHAIQTRRKDLDCQYTDRIDVAVVTDDAALQDAAANNADYIKSETLAVRLVFEPLPVVESVEVKIGAAKILLYVKVVQA